MRMFLPEWPERPGQPYQAQFNVNGGRASVAAAPYVPPAQVAAANAYFEWLRRHAHARPLSR